MDFSFSSSTGFWTVFFFFSHLLFLFLFLLLEAARNAGVDPVDDMSAKEKMHPFQKSQKYTGSNSVFYTPNENKLLQAPPTSFKQATKRSPKLWPKHHTLDPMPCTTEWVEPMQDFCQLHEHFGQEVRKLVAEWQKKRLEKTAQAEENLIDLE